MSTENEELFEGIQILSPSEIESQASSGTDEPPATTEEDTPPAGGSGEGGQEELTIVVPDTSGAGTVENTDEDEPSGSSDEPDLKTQKYQALIKDMMKDEIFAGVEEDELEEMLKEAGPETLKKLIQRTADTAFSAHKTNWENSFSGEKRRFLGLEDKFTDTDQAIRMAQQLEFLEGVTDADIEGNPELQKQLYYNYLMSKNFSQQEAVGMIEEADGIDKLLEKAKSSLPALKTQASTIVKQAEQQKAAMIEQQKETETKNFETLMNTVENREEFIPGMKINKIVREKVKNNMTTPVFTDEQGRQYTSLMYKQLRNPAEFQALMSYYDELGMFDIDKQGNFKPNISKIKTVAKTKAVQELDQVLSKEEEQGAGRSNSTRPSGKTSGLLNMLEQGFKD